MAFNKVILAGNIASDIEARKTSSGKSVVSFRLAVGRRFDKNATDFIDIVAWEKTADFIANYFTKGKPILVCGALQVRTWQDKDNKKRYATEVIADEVSFIEGKATPNKAQEPMSHEQAAQQFEEMTPDDSLPF